MATYKLVMSFCVGMELATMDDDDDDGGGDGKQLPTSLFALYLSIFALSTPLGVAAGTAMTELRSSRELLLVAGVLQGDDGRRRFIAL